MTDNDEYTAAYTYAADGLRLRAQESNHAHPDRFFLYDGVRPTAEGTLSGDTWTTTERYVWEGDSYYSPLVYLVYDNARYYPTFDGLGSTRQLTDGDEDVTDTYSYEAFGNSMGSTGSTVNPYRYVGSLGYYQTGSSLMHLGARYYMPEIGRFLQRDPLRVPANLYVYAGNAPTIGADPEGKQLWESIVGIVGVVVVGGAVYDIVEEMAARAARHTMICKRARDAATVSEKCGGQVQVLIHYPGTVLWPPLQEGQNAWTDVAWRKVSVGDHTYVHAVWMDIWGKYHDENCGRMD